MATVILKECATAFEAELVKGALASADIPCILQGINSQFIRAGFGAQTAFPIQVLVNEEDLDKARAMLASEKE